MNVLEILLPAVCVVMICLPLVKVFTGKVTKKEAKFRLYTHIACFFVCVIGFSLFQLNGMGVFAEGETAVNSITGTMAQGLGFLAAAAPAAIGAFSENDKNFGKAMIFVALGEGVAIYGVLISILIINKL